MSHWEDAAKAMKAVLETLQLAVNTMPASDRQREMAASIYAGLLAYDLAIGGGMSGDEADHAITGE